MIVVLIVVVIFHDNDDVSAAGSRTCTTTVWGEHFCRKISANQERFLEGFKFLGLGGHVVVEHAILDFVR